MKNLILLTLIATFAACTESPTSMKENHRTSSIAQLTSSLSAPDATKKPKKLEMHGDIRNDPYYWLNDRENPEVIQYLKDENQYKDSILSGTQDLRQKLFEEIKGRIKQTDMSVPYKRNGYYYITRYEEGKEYPIHSRKKDNLEAKEEILLDVNELARDYAYYAVGRRTVSPDNSILAFGEDTLSRRIYSIRFKDLNTGEMLDDKLDNTTGYAVWAADNKTVFYSTKDETLRAHKIYRHTLGTPQSQDQEVYHEDDPTFGTFVYKTKSDKFIVIGSFATLSSEYRTLPADDPYGEFTVFEPRARNHEYNISHDGNQWLVRTNLEAKNFRLMRCPEGQTGQDNWEEVIPHREDVLLEGTEIFKDYLVLSERIEGISKLRILPDQGDEYYIDFGEEAYLSYTSVNPEFDTDIVRIGFTSLTTPNSTYDFNMKSREKNLLKQQEVLGSFDPQDYKSERILVKARDGVSVPVSIVYHKDTPIDGSSPCLLYGYGSYGASMDPYFSSVRLSLLDRGFVYAIAHIRGGEEMGRHWYEDGKLLKKKNTFYDFIDCGKQLISKGYASEQGLYAMGGSAGGLLMGAVINMEPELWSGVIAAVPFVDVVTTMLDESIPLTAGEYDEWGNPNDAKYYKYIKSYSPYDQVSEQSYPPLLVTTGLHDSQVQYWEPAKWVAKLRDNNTSNHPILLHTNLETGHGGASGRFERYKETAMEYAFLLDLAGKAEL